MKHRIMMLLVGLSALAQAVSAAAQTRPAPAPAAQTAPAAKSWTPPKTPWGDPDLQGTYTSDDCINTPMQRPANLGEKLYFTEEELAQREGAIARQAENDKQQFVAANANVTINPPGHWAERARRPCRQTSLVVDPPDGRTPALTPESQARGGRGQRGGGGDELAAGARGAAPAAAGQPAQGGRGARGGGGANNNPANQPASWE